MTNHICYADYRLPLEDRRSAIVRWRSCFVVVYRHALCLFYLCSTCSSLPDFEKNPNHGILNTHTSNSVGEEAWECHDEPCLVEQCRFGRCSSKSVRWALVSLRLHLSHFRATFRDDPCSKPRSVGTPQGVRSSQMSTKSRQERKKRDLGNDD